MANTRKRTCSTKACMTIYSFEYHKSCMYLIGSDHATALQTLQIV